jgi:proline dehydrogenase
MSSLTDRLVVTTLPLVPKFVVRRVARLYIAGESLEDLVRVSKDLNAGGFLTIAAILGEFVGRREEALAAVADFERVLAVIQEEKLQSTIQVKLTQLGLKLDKEFSYQNMRRLVAAARERGNFARIDMEDSTCTDDTLEIYRRLRELVPLLLAPPTQESSDCRLRLQGNACPLRGSAPAQVRGRGPLEVPGGFGYSRHRLAEAK